MPDNALNADHIAAQNGNFEPVRKNNFVFEIILDDPNHQEAIALSVASGFHPEEENDDVEMSFGNEKRYAAGRVSFAEGTLTVRDYVDAVTFAALHAWRRLVYDPATGGVGNAADYKKQCHVRVHGPNGVAVRTWTLVGAYPKRAKWGESDYATSDQNMIELTIRYDKAFLGEQGAPAPAPFIVGGLD